MFYEARGRPLHAVRGVDLTISRGEIIALVGESGSGKSSVAMALLGLLPPSQANVTGSVSVLGVDMTTGDLAARTRIRKTGLGACFESDEFAQPDDDHRPSAGGGDRHGGSGRGDARRGRSPGRPAASQATHTNFREVSVNAS